MPTEEDTQNYRKQLIAKLVDNPGDVKTLTRLGALEFEYYYDHEKAISLFEKAIQINPFDVDAKFWLATCYYRDFRESEKAGEVIKEALQIEPNRPDCLSLMAWVILDINGPPKLAFEYAQKAISFAPEWPMLRYQMARIFYLLGNIEAAEQEIQKAYEMPLLKSDEIANEVERYYETVVTGRGWTDLDNKFEYLRENIATAKLNRSGSSELS